MFRVISYNIRAGLGTDGIRSIRRIASVLDGLRPDIVCLQEVDQHVPRSHLANQPKFLSMRLGMQALFQRNIAFGVGGYGNCVLVKPRAAHCRCHPLPGGGEPRGLLEVEACIDGMELTVLCTHLSTEEGVRELQARRVAEIVADVRKPKVLCGDFNAVRGSATIGPLMDDPILQDAAITANNEAPTYGRRNAGSRIDFVMPSRELTVHSYALMETTASDHLPVVVDLESAS